jgi:molybdenum cofactor guanylyltransferase
MVARPPETAPEVGVVLAGGASRRLGKDKALLAADGESLAARAVRKLRGFADVAVADGGRGLVPGVPSLPDGPGRGPAAGVLGAAAAYPERALVVLACDLPEVPEIILTALVIVGRGAEVDWAVPRWGGRLEPLCAIYQPAALAALARRVAEGRFALHELADEPGLRIAYLEEADIAGFGGDPARVFLNLNTPEDVARWLQTPGT